MVVSDYEKIFILRPDLSEEDANTEISAVSAFVTENGGTVTEEDRWGKRRLAYPIRKQRYGNYTVLRFSIAPGKIPEMEHKFRFNENFLKSLIMLHDLSTGKLSEREIKNAAKAAASQQDQDRERRPSSGQD